METIGVIIPTKKRFDEWVKTLGIDNKTYIHLNCIDKSRGQEFSEVIKSKDWYLVDNAEDILKEANHNKKEHLSIDEFLEKDENHMYKHV